jgi:carbonic anhydrase
VADVDGLMGAVEELLERNRRIAESAGGELPDLPRHRLVVLTCMDHRVDPAQVLGLELGDAVVIRNPGGRVTPAFLQQLAVLTQVFPEFERGEEPFELLLVQHTRCGFGGLVDHARNHELVADYFGVPTDRLAERSPSDPHDGVRADIELLAATDDVPGSLAISGLVYDMDSRRLELIERRAPLRP